MSFGGKSAMVKVEGLMVSGVVANISWDGKRHILEKQGWLTSVQVNGSSVKKHALKDKDKIKIGRSYFQYLLIDN